MTQSPNPPQGLSPAGALQPPTIQRPPIWPTVIGVLSIVLGAKTIVGGAGGLETQAAIGVFTGWGGFPGLFEGLSAAILIGMRAWRVLDAILLIVAGALLAGRRPAGAVLHVVFAIARIVELLALPFASWVAYRNMNILAGDYRTYITVSAVGSAIIGLAFPVFLLVWFRRADVRRHLAAYRRPEARRSWRPLPGSAWPAALGVVALIAAATSVLTLVNTLGSALITAALTESGGTIWGDGPPALLWVWFLWRGGGPSLLMGAGGLGLLQRRRAGGVLLLVYACLAVLTTIAGPVVEPIIYGAPRLYRSPMFLLTRIPSLLVDLVWPVFLMVWLLRENIRRQMRGWSARRP